MTDADSIWDVLVIGAGPAGAVAAAALAQRRLRVAILEKDLRPQAKPGEVLTPNTIPILSHLGLVDRIQADETLARPLACIDRAWPTAWPTRDYFLDQPGGRAWVVDRAALERLLVGRAILAGAYVLCGHRLQSLSRCNGYWSVQALANDDPVTLQASFLVDASGRPATVARRLRRAASQRLSPPRPACPVGGHDAAWAERTGVLDDRSRCGRMVVRRVWTT